jgi:hypothetical protein
MRKDKTFSDPFSDPNNVIRSTNIKIIWIYNSDRVKKKKDGLHDYFGFDCEKTDNYFLIGKNVLGSTLHKC